MKRGNGAVTDWRNEIKQGCLQMSRVINKDWGRTFDKDRLLLASTCVSMMWNMSAPLPARRLGILISTVDPGSLLGPLFMAWNHITQRQGKAKRSEYTASACLRELRHKKL